MTAVISCRASVGITAEESVRYGLASEEAGLPVTDGLLIHAEADMTGANLILSGSKVTDWGDAALTPFEQTVDAKRLTFVADEGDGLPALTCDGVDDGMITTANVSITTFSVFIVLKGATTNDMIYEHTVNGASNNGSWLFSSPTFGISHYRPAGNSAYSAAANPWPSGSWELVRHESDGTHANHTVFIDGVDQSWSEGLTDDPGSGATNDKLYLASRALTSLFWSGKIRALLLFTPKLSSGNTALTETYLGKHIP